MSSLKSNNEEKSFKVYVTDALKAIAENTTHFLGMEGMANYGVSITQRWIELFDTPLQNKEPEDDRPSEEIAADIWTRIRGH